MENFYKTSAWVAKRKQVLWRDNQECQSCKEQGLFTPGNTVHHIEPLEDRPDLALEDDNLITLCAACHNRIHNPISPTANITPERW